MVVTDYDPTDLDGQQARAEDAEQLRLAAVLTERSDLVWLLSGQRGRRVVRRQLREAGVTLAGISSSFHSNYGQMCFNEGLRVKALQVFSQITALLATGKLPLDAFQLLMTETD